MRCYICDFNDNDKGGKTHNHVFPHKGQPICQECFDSVADCLLEFEPPEDEQDDFERALSEVSEEG